MYFFRPLLKTSRFFCWMQRRFKQICPSLTSVTSVLQFCILRRFSWNIKIQTIALNIKPDCHYKTKVIIILFKTSFHYIILRSHFKSPHCITMIGHGPFVVSFCIKRYRLFLLHVPKKISLCQLCDFVLDSFRNCSIWSSSFYLFNSFLY